MHTFVMPCKFNSVIYESIEAIRKFYPNDSEIIVVDSDSEDKGYVDVLRGKGIIVDDVKNKNYLTGAIWHTFKNHKRSRYYFLHDSMIIKSRLDRFVNCPATSVRYFNSGNRLRAWIPGDVTGAQGFGFDDEGSRMWAAKKLSLHTNYIIPNLFTGLFGSALLCSRQVLENIYSSGFSNILPTRKIEDQTMERLWGIALHNEGYDVKTNTVCGNHNDNPSNDIIEKRIYVRL